MIALCVVAAWHRLKVLDEAIVSSDSLGPYLQAQAALFGHLPRPPNPESGDALWLLAVPLALVGLEIGAAVLPDHEMGRFGSTVAGAVVGLLVWLTLVIRMVVTRVRVSKISTDGDEVTFEQVADAFVKAAADDGTAGMDVEEERLTSW